jgi:hypothetical protein
LFPIVDLLGGKLPTIDDIPVSISNSNYYDEKYYIDRKITHQADMKKTQQISGLLATTEQQWDKLRQQDQTRNVHWLRKDKLGKLFGSKEA